MQNGIVLDFTGDFYDGPAELAKRFRLMEKRKRTLKNCEWYTPTNYIEAARKVMGSIDLDPASSEKANSVVKATNYFTIDDDGLKQKWDGNVFLNPPYSKGLLTRFVDKLLQEVALGNVKQAILLVQSSSAGTKWFHQVTSASQCFCLAAKRIFFWSPYAPNGLTPNGNKAGLLFGSIFFYFGPKDKQFEEVFSNFGAICHP
jgi:ParB family chromosome partitioning protein